MKAARVALAALLLIPGPSWAGVCKGGDPCKHCKDCSACWHCSPKNPKRGSCGVMRDQNGAQQRERDAKRAKTGK